MSVLQWSRQVETAAWVFCRLSGSDYGDHAQDAWLRLLTSGAEDERAALSAIYGGIRDGARRIDPLSRGQRRLVREVSELSGRGLTTQEIAGAIGASLDDVSWAGSTHIVSLCDSPPDVPDEADGPDEVVHWIQCAERLADEVGRLPGNLRKVAHDQLSGREAQQTARDLRVSKSRVTALRAKAMSLLQVRLK